MQSCGEAIIYHELARLQCEQWVQLETANLYHLKRKKEARKEVNAVYP